MSNERDSLSVGVAETPELPYWAVIFTSVQTDNIEGYGATADRMVQLAADMPGFLGIESARNEVGITVSYWADLESIKAWKRHAEHRIAQASGRQRWYECYKTRIARVERDYGFSRNSLGDSES